jgi:hypothetical protein
MYSSAEDRFVLGYSEHSLSFRSSGSLSGLILISKLFMSTEIISTAATVHVSFSNEEISKAQVRKRFWNTDIFCVNFL